VTLETLRRQIISCCRCPRLREYCARVAVEKKAAYRHDTYWGRPVPGFGDPRARLLVVGLAPAAHGANRTGRMFTGDSSGAFLMRALHRAGFASQDTSEHARDGLALTGVYVSATVRCAPPANRPTAAEIARCLPYLDAEMELLDSLRVIIALGRVAFDASWRLLVRRGAPGRPSPLFGHGRSYGFAGLPTLVASYHPSRQNTNTGRLTQAMFDHVFDTARRLVVRGSAASPRSQG
jgi:uracil-DNA glycosylase family 4